MKASELPSGWRIVELNDICREDRLAIGSDDPAYARMPYIGLEHIEASTGKVLVSEQDAQNPSSKSNNFGFTTEHVLYGKLRPYLNKVALPDFSGRCTTEIVPLKPISVERRWLAWVLRRQAVVDHAMRVKTGSRMPRTSMREFLKLRVTVPPLPEQRRVVDLLERQIATVDRMRSAATAQLANIAAMPRALFHSAFSEASWPKRLPLGWRWAELGDTCEIRKGRTAKRTWYADKGARLVRYRDLSEAGVNWVAGRHTFVDTAYEGKLERLRPGTVLVGADAHDPATIGRKVTFVATIPRTVAPAYFAGEMLGIRPNDDRPIEPEIVAYWLRSVPGYDEIQRHVSGGHLNVGPARHIRIPIPPVGEQRKLVANLVRQSAAIEHVRIIATDQARAVDALSEAVIQRAFEP